MSLNFSKKCVYREPLIVDRMSVTLAVIDSKTRKSIDRNLKMLGGGERRAGFASRKLYSLSYLFYASNVQESRHLLVQADPRTPNTPYLRIEYNPANVDLGEVRAIVDFILPGGWSQLVVEGVCSRIDLAVDVRGVLIRDLIMYWPGMRVSRQFFASGNVSEAQMQELETYYIGAYGGARFLCVYDRVACIKKANQTLVHKTEVPEQPTTRFEVRLRPKLLFQEMGLVSNPFAEIVVRDASALNFDGHPYFPLFLRAAQADGAQYAFKLLPEYDRKKFQKRIEAAGCTWWDPLDIWENFEPALAKVLSASPCN